MEGQRQIGSTRRTPIAPFFKLKQLVASGLKGHIPTKWKGGTFVGILRKNDIKLECAHTIWVWGSQGCIHKFILLFSAVR